MIFGGGSVGGGAIGTGIVFTLQDQFSATADKIATKFKTLDGVTEAAANKIDASVNKMKLGFASLAVGAGIIAALSFPVQKAAEFEAQLSSIKAVSGSTNAEMAQLRDLSLDMGKKTKYSALESAQGIEELVKAGISLNDVMNGGIEGALSLAAAGEIAVADAAEIASTALNTFKADNLSVSKAADILAGAANASATDVMGLKTGLAQVGVVAASMKWSMLDTSTALAVFAQNGMKGSDAGTSLKTMLSNLIPTSKQQIAVSRQLGLITKDGSNAFFDQQGRMKDLAGVAEVLQKSFTGLTDEQRKQYMDLLFGSDAIRASSILFKEGAAGVNEMQQAMTKFTAVGVAQERMNNFNGALEQFKGSWETLMIVAGSNFLKPLQIVVSLFQVLIDLFTDLASTQLGKYLMYVIGALGVGLVVLGAFVVLTNLMTFASGQLALAFMAVGQTAIAAAFAEGGMAAGLTAIATALVPLLVSLLPIIIAVGSLIYLFYKVKKGMEDFNAMADGTGERLSGISGVFQKIGGVIQAFTEIWSSATDEGFTLSEKTYQTLHDLGIFDFVMGMAKAMGYIRQAFKIMGDIAMGVWSLLQPIFGSIGNLIKTVAIIIGVVLVGAAIAWTVSMASAAIATIAAMWPLLLIIGIIIAIVYVIKNWGKIWDWLVEAFKTGVRELVKAILAPFVAIAAGLIWLYQNWDAVWSWVGDKVLEVLAWIGNGFLSFMSWLSGVPAMIFNFWLSLPQRMLGIFLAIINFGVQLFTSFVNWLFSLPERFVEWGVNLVTSIYNGIMSAWEWLKSELIGLIAELPGGSIVLDALGIDTGQAGGANGGGVVMNPAPIGGPSAIGQTIAQQKASQGKETNSYSQTVEKKETLQTVILKVDGRDIKTTMDKVDKEQDSRK